MISILIPVYNTNVCDLASVLSDQLLNFSSPAEIIVIDDGSDEKFLNQNSPVANLPFVNYVIEETNVGRIQIRKKLSSLAAYNYLMFIDGDSKIFSDQFLKNYFKYFPENFDVISGGRVYESAPPLDNEYILHWKYGTTREKIKPLAKKTNSFYGFKSNNFVIKKDVFLQIGFNKNLIGYGHEDSLLGIELEKLNCSIKYIDNPVLHLGLDDTDTYISKSVNALLNLKIISNEFPAKAVSRHVKLFRYYNILKWWHLRWLFKLLIFPLKYFLEKNIHSSKPSLFLFDLYRLYYFINL